MKKPPHPNPVALWIYGGIHFLTALFAALLLLASAVLFFVAISGNLDPYEEVSGWVFGWYLVWSILFCNYYTLTKEQFAEVKAMRYEKEEEV